MDDTEFRETLEGLEPGDEDGLIGAVQQRVRALSSRHLDIQERIQSSDRTRRDLEERLESAERKIVEQVDASVEQEVTSIDDVEGLPDHASVEFDPDLLAEVREIREQARSNYRTTAAEGEDLQAELADNSDELQLHQEVLTAMEADELSTAEARARLLEFFGGHG